MTTTIVLRSRDACQSGDGSPGYLEKNEPVVRSGTCNNCKISLPLRGSFVGVRKILDPRDHLGMGQAIALGTARVIYIWGSALITNGNRNYRLSMSKAPGSVIPSADQPPNRELDHNTTEGRSHLHA